MWSNNNDATQYSGQHAQVHDVSIVVVTKQTKKQHHAVGEQGCNAEGRQFKGTHIFAV